MHIGSPQAREHATARAARAAPAAGEARIYVSSPVRAETRTLRPRHRCRIKRARSATAACACDASTAAGFGCFPIPAAGA